jgi:8-oxo-dGTP pyrophosphatase MutT (NUDIX family)
MRELYEETGLRANAACVLYRAEWETCFLLEPEPDQEPTLGYDPELGPQEQMITAIGWKPLSELVDDIQVSKVIAALNRDSPSA